MSGAAKDGSDPILSAGDAALAALGETSQTVVEDAAALSDAGPAAADASSGRDDSDGKVRRGAAFLRVVSDNDPEALAAARAAPQRIGDIIRAARENAGYTLAQVRDATKINLSHLRAIEDMTPGLLGPPVYAKGYIRSYARYLGLPEQDTLDRFLSECAAILKDPAKPEIAPPATSKARRLPVAVPALGLVLAGLLAGGAVLFFASSGGPTAPDAAPSAQPAAGLSGSVAAPVMAPQLRIVAIKRGLLEVRSAKGDKYVHRNYNPGEFFIVRVGEGFTVSADDGTAFEWRLGDQSLGLLQASGGPVYTQSADLAAQRPPVVLPPALPEPVAPSALDANATAGGPAAAGAPAPAPRPRPAATRPPAEAPAASPPAVAAEPAPPPPPRDPALDAYPGQ